MNLCSSTRRANFRLSSRSDVQSERRERPLTEEQRFLPFAQVNADIEGVIDSAQRVDVVGMQYLLTLEGEQFNFKIYSLLDKLSKI